MSPRKIIAIGLVVILHILIGYAFITGLAINVIKKTVKDLSVVDVKDQPPPPPEPPPPPPEQKVEPPPLVSPPPIVSPPQISAPPMVTVPQAPPVVITPLAPQAPAPPPPPRISQAASARGDPAQWISDADYPSAAMREERQGVSRISWQINEAGRVENCVVTASSGSPDLDQAACAVITRRGRYTPAKDESGRPMRSTASRSVRWTIPKD